MKDTILDQEYKSDTFYVRPVNGEDKELFKGVVAAENIMGKIYNIMPEIALDSYWSVFINDEEDLNYSVFLNDGTFIGRVALQGINKGYPELAIILIKEYQGQGLGYRLLMQWLNWVYESLGYKRILVKVDSTNKKSLGLFNKIAVKVSEADITEYYIDLPISISCGN
jgi:RimJ/RimL family protein N-acetyltransferase